MGKEWCLIHKHSAQSCCKAKLNEEVHKNSLRSIYLAEMHHVYKRAHSCRSWIWATQPSNSLGIAENSRAEYLLLHLANTQLQLTSWPLLSLPFLLWDFVLLPLQPSPYLTCAPKASSVQQHSRYGLTFPAAAAEAVSWSSCLVFTCVLPFGTWNPRCDSVLLLTMVSLCISEVFSAILRVNSRMGWKNSVFPKFPPGNFQEDESSLACTPPFSLVLFGFCICRIIMDIDSATGIFISRRKYYFLFYTCFNSSWGLAEILQGKDLP